MPSAIAVTIPAEEIVATAVLEDAHGIVASGVPEPVNCSVLPPTVIICTPERVGIAFTLTVIAVRGPSQLDVLFF